MSVIEDTRFLSKRLLPMLPYAALQRSCVIALVGLTSAIPAFALGDDPPGVPAKPLQAEFVRAVLETALKHHTEPPTRQQLIVDVLKSIAAKLGHPLPRSLAIQVSDISNTEELYRFLNTQLTECHFYESQECEQLLTDGLQSALTGSVKLIPRKEHLVNEQLAANQYVGVGIQVAQVAEQMKVVSVFEGGPAFEAGLLADDIIESVDGKPTKGESLSTSIERLRGPVGTTITLMARAPGQAAREMTIERRVVPLKTVEIVKQEHIRDDFTVINILQITASTVSDLKKLIDEIPGSVDTIVLDLSRATVSETNSGLHSVHLFADALLDDCELGQLMSRTGTRKLQSEEGNILGGRKLVFFYIPRTNNYVDWLAANLNSQGHFVCFENAMEQAVRLWNIGGDAREVKSGQSDFDTNGVGAYETFEVNNDYYITLLSTWLTANTPRRPAVVEFDKLIRKPRPSVKP